ncbi:DUF1289 domain-containing protein [Sphingobium sp. AN641]|uniref:DUF1289 domain-containing protein n=1 Tax=Sphingobium sp. AN641 TaxID=3133443 RepID=UPI0030BC346A
MGAPIETPCIRQCTLDTRDVCIGCRRTLAEILRWRDMSHSERRAIMARLAAPLPPPAS